MKNLKKLMCSVLASSMMLTACACGNSDKGANPGSGVDASVKSDGVMAENKLETAKVNQDINVFKKDENFKITGIKGTIGHYKVVGDSIYLTTNESPTAATASDAANSIIVGGIPLDNSNICRLYKVPATGGEAKLIYESDDASTGNSLRFLVKKPDGTLIVEMGPVDCSGDGYKYFELNGDSMNETKDYSVLSGSQDDYVSDIVCDKDGNFVMVVNDNQIRVYDQELNKINETSIDDIYNFMGVDANGDVIISTSAEAGEGKCDLLFRKFDPASGKLDEGQNLGGIIASYDVGIMTGTDGYDFYYSTDSCLYGYNYDSNKSTEVLTYNAAGINKSSIRYFEAVNSESFICRGFDANYVDNPELERIAKADPSEVADKTVLTMASMGCDDTSFEQMILDYNNSQDDNMIVLVDYSQVADSMSKFSADVSAGTTPDLYYISQSFGDMPVNQCIAKGMFEDLTPYMEKDTEISSDDIIPSVYNNMLVDGKLYYTCSSVDIYSLAGKKSVVGEESGWTMNDMKGCVDSLPEGTQIFGANNKDTMLSTFMWGGITDDYVDWNKGECSFDSQEFKDLLAMCNTGTNSEEISVTPDTEALNSGEEMLVSTYCINPNIYAAYKNAFDGDFSFKGYPSNRKTEGIFRLTSGVAMSTQCENKDAAWDFIRYLFTEDCQSKSYVGSNGIPTRKDVFDVFVEEFTWNESGKDKYGNDIMITLSDGQNGDINSVRKPVSQDDVNNYKAFVDSCGGYYGCDRNIWNIISEEAASYFSGDKSLDDVCSIIQDRVSTYVNENK